jgi:hypothetical protein
MPTDLVAEADGDPVDGGLAFLLCRLRGRALLTQEQLVERAGVSTRTIWRRESGTVHRLPSSRSGGCRRYER